MTRYEALLEVRAHFPNQEAMAEFFGVSQPTVCRWLTQSKQLPHDRVIAAERETGISRHLLRPDIYPLENTSHPAADPSVEPELPIDCAPIMTRRNMAGQSNRREILDGSAAA